MKVKQNLAFVIEDDVDLSNIFVEILRSVGYEVEIFVDGQAAYERLQGKSESDFAPCLVLLDMHLPNVTGHEIAWDMWFNLEEDTHIIIVTADPLMAAPYRNKAGVDRVYIKPLPRSTLIEDAKEFLVPVH